MGTHVYIPTIPDQRPLSKFTNNTWKYDGGMMGISGSNGCNML